MSKIFDLDYVLDWQRKSDYSLNDCLYLPQIVSHGQNEASEYSEELW
ncbi:MAG: hypothetical protein XE05_2007, partial [Thermotogales bacterium 46_20]|jgi:hypothetical protein